MNELVLTPQNDLGGLATTTRDEKSGGGGENFLFERGLKLFGAKWINEGIKLDIEADYNGLGGCSSLLLRPMKKTSVSPLSFAPIRVFHKDEFLGYFQMKTFSVKKLEARNIKFIITS